MKKLAKTDFVNKSNILHNFQYNYDQTEYINKRTKLIIFCPKHGQFNQSPDSHLQGKGCKKCGYESCSKTLHSSLEAFKEKANAVHNQKYSYKSYTNSKIKIEICCPDHGSFWQTPNAHLTGKQGCPKCANTFSKLEKNWLDGVGVPDDSKYRQVKIKLRHRNIKADGFIPQTNTVYEFWGDYWHGNPNKYDPNEINVVNKKTFGELYEETQQKICDIKAFGFNLIQIWESDFRFYLFQGSATRPRARLTEAESTGTSLPVMISVIVDGSTSRSRSSP